MSRIYPLPVTLVNQIAAGEVIERPASVVKELLENSIDAKATQISVKIVDGGRQLIRVSDNGSGISPEDLILAVTSHATSKLRNAEDLFQLHTMGFRGEALASIGAISQLRLRSRQESFDAGAEIDVHGGEVRPVQACGTSPGTIVEVNNLFFNTPARRKFLRTTQTEMNHITESFLRIALANPHVHLTLEHNNRVVHDLPNTDHWLERLELFFGRELIDHLMPIESKDETTRLWGYVADPSQSRPNTRWQHLFLNGRFIKDRSLSHALNEAYRGLLMTGRFPIAFLQMEMSPELVDVNVHPTKLEVRFQESSRIYNQVVSTLRHHFLDNDLTATLETEKDQRPTSAVPPYRKKESLPSRPALPATSGSHEPFSKQYTSHGGPTDPNQKATLPTEHPSSETTTAPQSSDSDPFRIDASERASGPHPQNAFTPKHKAIQLHNAYLVAETPDGMTVFDQHALHERILYEELRERVLQESMETQRLLIPEVIDLTPSEASIVLENKDSLAPLGIEIEPFGGSSVLVKTFPTMLENLSPQLLLRDLIDQLEQKNRALESRDLIDSLLHSISCKAAIKAGQHLSEEEVDALINRRHLVDDAHHCPHGRPTSLVFTKDHLEKQFKRT